MKNILFTLSLLFVATFGVSQEKLNVVASTTIFADMAEVIGGDKVDVKSICAVGTDPHTYEPIPNDVIMIKNADVILINGLTLEGWMSKLIENSGSKAAVQVITEGITPISSEKYANAYDPHAWMVAENGIIYADNIRKVFSKVDPKNADFYNEKFETYKQELTDLHQYIKEQVVKIPVAKRLIVTSHDAFKYFGKEYGMKLSALQGMSTEAEAQTSDLIRVNKQIKESGVPAIFVESTISPKMQEQIAKQNKVSIGGELYADALGEKGSSGDTYLKMLKSNTDVIVKALTAEKVAPQEEKGSNIWLYVGIGLLMILSIFGVLKMMK